MVRTTEPARFCLRQRIIGFTALLTALLVITLGNYAGGITTAYAAENLIQNGSFETVATPDTPAGWSRGRWGNNTAVFSYPVAGASGSAAQVQLSNRVSGDAKWAFPRVSVEAGAQYRYRNEYKASVPTYITVEFQKADGSLSYLDLTQPAAASSFTPTEVIFTVPEQVTRLTVFHLINQPGTLTIDSASLEKVSAAPPPPPPPSASNLIPNPSLETADGSGTAPEHWGEGRWGSNTAVFTYPASGVHGARAASLTLSNYASGDAKWYFKRISPLEDTAYEFSNQYRSSVTSYVTVEFTFQSGARTYRDLAVLEPTGGAWETFEGSFVIPEGAVALTVFHLIKSNGSLTIDNYVLKKATGGSASFDQAYVTLTFDDGRRSTYDIGLPIVEAAGFTSTHFIVSGRMSDAFPGYINPDEVVDISNRGHEIGAHTRTHADLRTLSQSQLESEVAGSKADLDALGIPEVTSFAFPFGSYDARVIDAVEASGLTAARTTQDGSNLPHEKPLELKRIAGDGTPLAVLKQHIDEAIENETWLILAFHDITATPGTYNTSPETLRGIVSYLKEKGVAVVTLRQGAQLLQP